MTSEEIANGEHKVLSAADITRHDRMQGLVDRVPRRDWITKLARS